ncbi:MAG: PHP domain-containing protein [Clostridia bacterium]|nr:PHP domain-containing protein [Clostridia bacterium]
MNRQVFNYSVIPSIVRADTVSQIRIRPLGENGKFKQGLSYQVSVRAVETASRHYDALPTAVYEVVPDEDGCLVFEHTFVGEQKHVIFLTRPEEDMRSLYYEINNHRGRFGENASVTLAVYSLREDLYGLKCYKGEVHCHTCESDGIQDPLHTVGNYRNAGYDFMAITDHFTSYASEKAMRVFRDAPVSMTLFLGEEVHVPTERIHAVHIGGRESINEYFRSHREAAFARVAEIEAALTLPDTVDRNDYAWRVFIAEKAREFGGLAILAHPFWVWSSVYFIAPAAAEQLMRDGVYDALDLRDDDMEAAVALWADLRADGVKIPIVGSTDSHRSSPDDPKLAARGGYTLVFAPDRSHRSITDAIRADRSLCVSTKSDPEFVYGSFRLVKLARFLLDHYYPVYQKLCWGQGTLMAEYPVEGMPDAKTVSLLAALNERSDAFSREFYGY